jgi:hypothetical protein
LGEQRDISINHGSSQNLEQTNESALRITCDLADRFKSRVIGITAGFPNMPVHSHGMIGSSVLEADYKELKQAMLVVKVAFARRLKASATHQNAARTPPIRQTFPQRNPGQLTC